MMEKLNTTDLINAIAEKTGSTKTDAEFLVKNVIELIEESLEKESSVKVKGLGTFKLKRVASRIGRNLQTGEEVEIPPHNKVTFTPEKELKELVNKEYEFLTYKEVEEEKPVASAPPEEKKEEPETEKPLESKSDPVKPEDNKEPNLPPPVPPPPEEEYDDVESSRRGYHWIIPVAVIIIAILAVVFYFRACQDRSDDAKTPPEEEQVISPVEEPVDTLAPEEPVVDEPEEILEPEPRPMPVTPEEDLLYVLEPGNYLYQLAGKFYGDSLFWVLIYRENADKIDDPEEVTEGSRLVIPKLEGTRYNLSRQDSMNLSEGYRMLYEYYMIREDLRTSNFYYGMVRYMPR